MRVDAVEMEQARQMILKWTRSPRSHGATGAVAAAKSGRLQGYHTTDSFRSPYVCAANVHMVMTSWNEPSFRAIVNDADLVVPDGVPMVWALRLLGVPQRRRVRVSPDLVLDLLAHCERESTPVALYGGTPASLERINERLLERFPRLRIVAAIAPPFRDLTEDEDERYTRQLRESGARLVFAGVGCPKQERWMAAHAVHLDAVLVGVGAAFDLLAGDTSDAPRWMRDIGLEWVWRLALEPRRLWRRYLFENPRFLILFAIQAVMSRLQSARP